MIYYKLYIRGYSPIFPNLITKESYNWWVTRRVWGFRRQISKAKYLKMSVANIGKLQENTAKISQNVSRKYLEASGEHRGTVQNICETLRVSAQRIQICLTGEVETPSSPIWRQGLDAKYLEKVCAGCETSGWNGGKA